MLAPTTRTFSRYESIPQPWITPPSLPHSGHAPSISSASDTDTIWIWCLKWTPVDFKTFDDVIEAITDVLFSLNTLSRYKIRLPWAFRFFVKWLLNPKGMPVFSHWDSLQHEPDYYQKILTNPASYQWLTHTISLLFNLLLMASWTAELAIQSLATNPTNWTASLQSLQMLSAISGPMGLFMTALRLLITAHMGWQADRDNRYYRQETGLPAAPIPANRVLVLHQKQTSDPVHDELITDRITGKDLQNTPTHRQDLAHKLNALWKQYADQDPNAQYQELYCLISLPAAHDADQTDYHFVYAVKPNGSSESPVIARVVSLDPHSERPQEQKFLQALLSTTAHSPPTSELRALATEYDPTLGTKNLYGFITLQPIYRHTLSGYRLNPHATYAPLYDAMRRYGIKECWVALEPAPHEPDSPRRLVYVKRRFPEPVSAHPDPLPLDISLGYPITGPIAPILEPFIQAKPPDHKADHPTIIPMLLGQHSHQYLEKQIQTHVDPRLGTTKTAYKGLIVTGSCFLVIIACMVLINFGHMLPWTMFHHINPAWLKISGAWPVVVDAILVQEWTHALYTDLTHLFDPDTEKHWAALKKIFQTREDTIETGMGICRTALSLVLCVSYFYSGWTLHIAALSCNLLLCLVNLAYCLCKNSLPDSWRKSSAKPQYERIVAHNCYTTCPAFPRRGSFSGPGTADSQTEHDDSTRSALKPRFRSKSVPA